MKLIISILAFTLFNLYALGQSADMDLLENEFISLENFDNGKEAFHEAFSQVRLIGLGEATHGTSEFFAIKAELIKYLVLNEGFNTVIFEGSYSNSELINRYITQGEGNVYDAIIGLGPWCWYTKEVFDLVEWLKDYNTDKSAENRVQFYGCDMQILKFAVDKLIAYLGELDGLNRDLQPKLESVKALSTKRKLNKEDHKLIRNVIDQLHLIFANLNNPETEANSVSYHNLRILEQWYERITAKKSSWNKRDEFMAENIAFILSLNENNKAIVWAHNAHVAMTTGNHQKKLVPMGSHLKKQFGANYFALGFGFNSGSFNARNGNERTVTVGNAEDGSSDLQFSKSQHTRFFLNIRNLKSHIPLIHEEIKSRNIGERYDPKHGYRYHTLANSYSGLIFVKETNTSQLLDFSLIK